MISFLLSVRIRKISDQKVPERIHGSSREMRKTGITKKKIIYLFAAVLPAVFTLAVSVHASDTGITVNNYVTEPEKAFTAEDLRRLLDTSLSVNETVKKDGGYLPGREGKTDANKDGYPEGGTEYDGSADKEDPEQNGGTEDDIYIPDERDKWMLLLVNKQNPIPDDYAPELTNVNGSIKIRSEIALPLSEMFDEAEKDGISLMVCSGYRSHEHQRELFDRKIRNYTGRGLSYLDAFRIGSYSVIIPGTSEHELGMALDIVTPGYMSLDEGFADTRAGKWLKDNAYKYGFILRYPKGKEYITGIIFEPWHYRYVGREAARIITEKDLTLEEYIEEAEYRYDNEAVQTAETRK